MKYLVVDISTTAQEGIEDSPYLSWANKKGAQTPEEAYSKAGLHAEYGMVCSLSSMWVEFDSREAFKITDALTMSADNREDEETMLLKFEELLQSTSGKFKLVGHNIKDFTVPFLAKRYLGNGLRIPNVLRDAMRGNVIDIMKELACGGVSVMSLRSSAWLFGVDDPRSGMRSPRFYELVKQGLVSEVEGYTRANAKVAAEVFANCALGGLVDVEASR